MNRGSDGRTPRDHDPSRYPRRQRIEEDQALLLLATLDEKSRTVALLAALDDAMQSEARALRARLALRIWEGHPYAAGRTLTWRKNDDSWCCYAEDDDGRRELLLVDDEALLLLTQLGENRRRSRRIKAGLDAADAEAEALKRRLFLHLEILYPAVGDDSRGVGLRKFRGEYFYVGWEDDRSEKGEED